MGEYSVDEPCRHSGVAWIGAGVDYGNEFYRSGLLRIFRLRRHWSDRGPKRGFIHNCFSNADSDEIAVTRIWRRQHSWSRCDTYRWFRPDRSEPNFGLCASYVVGATANPT